MTRAGPALFLIALSLEAGASAAPFDALEQNGWYTWRVEAIDDAPAWCCFNGSRETPARQSCNLDSRHAGYGGCHYAGPPNGFVQVYAKVESGETVELRALSPSCPVGSESRIADLGSVDAGTSFEWLKRRVGVNSRVGRNALAAIALHRGEAPLRYLISAASGAAEGAVREDAIFWLGQVRISDASGTIERLMSADDDPGIRQHAAFALSQSTSPNRTRALIRQGRQDADGDTRARAWFWLAQTGASEGESAILQAIATDPDARVREEAVFALSQLPEERAVDALLAVLEDRRLNRAVREKALFWLAQSGSDRGLAIVERLITGGEARLY